MKEAGQRRQRKQDPTCSGCLHEKQTNHTKGFEHHLWKMRQQENLLRTCPDLLGTGFQCKATGPYPSHWISKGTIAMLRHFKDPLSLILDRLQKCIVSHYSLCHSNVSFSCGYLCSWEETRGLWYAWIKSILSLIKQKNYSGLSFLPNVSTVLKLSKI